MRVFNVLVMTGACIYLSVFLLLSLRSSWFVLGRVDSDICKRNVYLLGGE
jgi:hypothetical protein